MCTVILKLTALHFLLDLSDFLRPCFLTASSLLMTFSRGSTHTRLPKCWRHSKNRLFFLERAASCVTACFIASLPNNNRQTLPKAPRRFPGGKMADSSLKARLQKAVTSTDDGRNLVSEVKVGENSASLAENEREENLSVPVVRCGFLIARKCSTI